LINSLGMSKLCEMDLRGFSIEYLNDRSKEPTWVEKRICYSKKCKYQYENGKVRIYEHKTGRNCGKAISLRVKDQEDSSRGHGFFAMDFVRKIIISRSSPRKVRLEGGLSWDELNDTSLELNFYHDDVRAFIDLCSKAIVVNANNQSKSLIQDKALFVNGIEGKQLQYCKASKSWRQRKGDSEDHANGYSERYANRSDETNADDRPIGEQMMPPARSSDAVTSEVSFWPERSSNVVNSRANSSSSPPSSAESVSSAAAWERDDASQEESCRNATNTTGRRSKVPRSGDRDDVSQKSCRDDTNAAERRSKVPRTTRFDYGKYMLFDKEALVDLLVAKDEELASKDEENSKLKAILADIQERIVGGLNGRSQRQV